MPTLTPGATEMNALVHRFPARSVGGYSVGYQTAYGSDEKQRSFRVRLPAGYTPTKRYPLIVCLHGGRSGGEDQEQLTRLSDRADEDWPFVAVYPDGLGWDIVQILPGGSGSITSLKVGGDELLTGSVAWTTDANTTAAALAAAVGANGYTAFNPPATAFVYFGGPHGGSVVVSGTMSSFVAKLNPGWNASDQVSTLATPATFGTKQGVPETYPDTDTWAERWHLPDVDFIRQLVRWCQVHIAIDAQHIYCMGFSNGSRMTHRLARELYGTFAAVAGIGAGLMLTNYDANSPFRNTPPRPVPLWYGHGTLDPLALFGGAFPYPASGQVAGDWASYNLSGTPNAYYLNPVETCKEMVAIAGGDPNAVELSTIAPTVVDIYSTSAIKTRWTGLPGNWEVELWTLINTGHTWPAPPSEEWAYVTGNWAVDINFIGRPNRQLSATREMLAFFARHRFDSNLTRIKPAARPRPEARPRPII